MPIIRRKNCVYVTLGTCYSVCMTVWYAGWHTRQSSIQNNRYQVSQKHSFSWWWAHSSMKHVETNKYTKNKFVTHGFVHRRLLSRNTNKMQLCNRIYYSKVFLNAQHGLSGRSSSGALNCICGLWFICPYGDRPLQRLSGHHVHSTLVMASHHTGV